MYTKREQRAVTVFAVVLFALALAIFGYGAYAFGYANPYIVALALIYACLGGVVASGLRALH